ncbi:MAG: hypothetical protein A3F31_01160 [Candidatus Levybacteria bacterium RIFCSPHIGHO2_12_FULL_38_12]|nr:MAG: hypothetical protein A2770_01770 [Candidatus Levybacteria bacterium RIFCSPHIGHO2_01_FULL_38_12]OGH22051.1 MAG: hypothetical protein A3D75_03300 [Candidatus Levybacteria bacterium RIFCSPHIGHO2_02_FULL_37_18]OGH23275.1 MAG: hypothetical protein A3F31_01160 [Candidatus Levybacteria bacterium RIFCSPHIGHO2_12_FULL_38_12]OGH33745.1 MAG: hypothetical protein A3A47_02735 [Candidatus Levybacteria bacterium RIFCSPLOWO2_01_FULL_37_20]OGH44650.1 MAG: hypothetical protein A3J14_00820 [Candidatus Lev
MPVIKSAKKKLRKDRKREKENNKFENILKTLIKKAKKIKTEKAIIQAVRTADKAAKKRIIHKNKASRLKSQLYKLIAKTPKAAVKTTSKKTPKK